MNPHDPLLISLLGLKEELMLRTVEFARTPHENMYKVGRNQGLLDGLKFAIEFVEGKIEAADKAD